MRKWIIGVTSLLLFLTAATPALRAQGMNGPPRPEGRMKPPPEAVAACQGKSEGTAVQFTTPGGNTLKGVCKQVDGVLAALPERGAPPTGMKPPGAERDERQTN
jgi:hypothetical protein